MISQTKPLTLSLRIQPCPARKALRMRQPGLLDLSEGVSCTLACLQEDQHGTPETAEALGAPPLPGTAPSCLPPPQQQRTGPVPPSKTITNPPLRPNCSLLNLFLPRAFYPCPRQQHQGLGRGGNNGLTDTFPPQPGRTFSVTC